MYKAVGFCDKTQKKTVVHSCNIYTASSVWGGGGRIYTSYVRICLGELEKRLLRRVPHSLNVSQEKKFFNADGLEANADIWIYRFMFLFLISINLLKGISFNKLISLDLKSRND